MFTILFACTGNRCRSPYAEVYFARLTDDLPVEVLSAGTLDAPGYEVPAELIDIADEIELDLNEHRSRPLGHVAADSVDLFVGFERAHVAAAVVEAGIDADKAFTLPELVRLLRQVEVAEGADPVERARKAVAAAAERRSQGGEFVPGEEVADPFLRSRSTYEKVAGEIAELCDELHARLFRGN